MTTQTTISRGLLALVCVALVASPASAFFHLWRFTEFFSNHDGSVQFIELHSSGSAETVSQGATITSMSTGKVFTFPSNLTGNTSNRRLLIATPGFASLTGAVAPDFTLPSTSFFSTATDTISLFQFQPIDTKSFTSVPTDGVMSRHYNPANGQTSLGANTPTNYAGQNGSVNVSPPAMPTGDYNGNGTVDAADYALWRNTLNQTVSMGTGADGSSNGTVDAADYDFWRARFGNTVPGAGSAASVPEATTVALFLVAIGALAHRQKTWLRLKRPMKSIGFLSSP